MVDISHRWPAKQATMSVIEIRFLIMMMSNI